MIRSQVECPELATLVAPPAVGDYGVGRLFIGCDLSGQHPPVWLEVAAVKNYLGALQDFNVALTLDERASGPIKQSLAAADGTHDAGITSREREVLRRIAAGRSSREIAAELGVAFRTVVCHRYRIYRKLKIHKTVDLVRAAMRMGLTEL